MTDAIWQGPLVDHLIVGVPTMTPAPFVAGMLGFTNDTSGRGRVMATVRL
jgi:hypothetical protein